MQKSLVRDDGEKSRSAAWSPEPFLVEILLDEAPSMSLGPQDLSQHVQGNVGDWCYFGCMKAIVHSRVT